MKVTIKKATGILVIPDNFAQLVEVTDDSYVYELTYQINPVTAIKQSSYSVSIRIKNTPAVKKQTQIFFLKLLNFPLAFCYTKEAPRAPTLIQAAVGILVHADFDFIPDLKLVQHQSA